MTALPQFFAIYSTPLLSSLPTDIADVVFAASGDESTTFRTHAYKITDQGWGQKYSNPSTSPTGRTWDSKFRPQGDAVGWALISNSPYAEAYAFSNSGYGSRYANMASIPPSSPASFGWSPAGTEVLVGASTATGLNVYAWSSGWGTKYSSPVGLEAGAKATFSKDSNYIFQSEAASPYLAAYGWSSSGFGSKFSDPSAATEESTSIPATNSDSSVVIVGQNATPYVKAYAFSAAGWGSAFSEPTTKFTTAVVGGPSQVEFNSSGTYVAMSHTGAANEFNCAIYAWSGGWGSLLSDPASKTNGVYSGIAWVGNSFIVATRNASPFVFLYGWTGSGWGTLYSSPVTLPSVVFINSANVRLY